MLAEKPMPDTAATEQSHRTTFFRQSGWMIIATVASGFFMWLMQVVCSRKLPETEYAAFGTLIQRISQLTIPALGLQMVFAQQASAAVTNGQRRQLVSTIRGVTIVIFAIWLIMMSVVYLGRDRFLPDLKLSNEAALWLSMLSVLGMLLLPIYQGLLQGRQNFLWLGWVAIFNGVGRFAIGAFVLFVLGGLAAGATSGILIGLVLAVAAAAWQNADLLREPGASANWVDWVKRVVPLTFGAGAFTFIFSEDVPIVQKYLGQNGSAADYIFGGTLARAIVWFTVPLAAVMFPKLVHSAARAHKHSFNLLGLTLLGTAVLGALAAIGLTVTAPLLIQYGSNPQFKTIIPLIPLFAWIMVVLSLANVLLNNLMAHSHFKVVPLLLVLAAGYWVALQHYHDSYQTVLKTLGLVSLLFLAICAAFTWLPGLRTPRAVFESEEERT